MALLQESSDVISHMQYIEVQRLISDGILVHLLTEFDQQTANQPDDNLLQSMRLHLFEWFGGIKFHLSCVVEVKEKNKNYAALFIDTSIRTQTVC